MVIIWKEREREEFCLEQKSSMRWRIPEEKQIRDGVGGKSFRENALVLETSASLLSAWGTVSLSGAPCFGLGSSAVGLSPSVGDGNGWSDSEVIPQPSPRVLRGPGTVNSVWSSWSCSHHWVYHHPHPHGSSFFSVNLYPLAFGLLEISCWWHFCF